MAGAIDRQDFRELTHAVDRLVKASERTAFANEELIRLATEERETSVEPTPPFCPHCGAFDPAIHSAGGQGEGPMSEFVLPATCGICKQSFYAIPEGWHALRTREEAAAYFNERGGESDKHS